MSLHKPSREEDEYFAREDALRRYRLAKQAAVAMEAEARARMRSEHYMKCPKCGFELEPVIYRGVTIDKCFHCNGSWLDAGELEHLAGRETHILQEIVSLFTH